MSLILEGITVKFLICFRPDVTPPHKFKNTPSLAITGRYFKHYNVLLRFLYARLNQRKQMKRGNLVFIVFHIYMSVNLPDAKIRSTKILNLAWKIDQPLIQLTI